MKTIKRRSELRKEIRVLKSRIQMLETQRYYLDDENRILKYSLQNNKSLEEKLWKLTRLIQLRVDPYIARSILEEVER